MKQRLLYCLCRTPLHVTADTRVSPVDYPTQRERHTRLPVIPGAVVKAGFASLWTSYAPPADPGGAPRWSRDPECCWLFGSNDPARPGPGALRFTEARLLAFPVRSARAGFGWVTSPLILRRYARDGGLQGAPGGLVDPEWLPAFALRDDQAVWSSPWLAIGDRVVLEEYTLYRARGEGGKEVAFPARLASELARILPDDPVWGEVAQRLVIVNDSLMTFLSQSACEVVAADRDAHPGPAYQENVPAETLFYGMANCMDEAEPGHGQQPAETAWARFEAKLAEQGGVAQFGADAGAGLGLCAVTVRELTE